MKVVQSYFRNYMNLRDWGWFIIIQKTRPPIGQPDPNQELIDLENKCNAAYGALH